MVNWMEMDKNLFFPIYVSYKVGFNSKCFLCLTFFGLFLNWILLFKVSSSFFSIQFFLFCKGKKCLLVILNKISFFGQKRYLLSFLYFTFFYSSYGFFNEPVGGENSVDLVPQVNLCFGCLIKLPSSISPSLCYEIIFYRITIICVISQ